MKSIQVSTMLSTSMSTVFWVVVFVEFSIAIGLSTILAGAHKRS